MHSSSFSNMDGYAHNYSCVSTQEYKHKTRQGAAQTDDACDSMNTTHWSIKIKQANHLNMKLYIIMKAGMFYIHSTFR